MAVNGNMKKQKEWILHLTLWQRAYGGWKDRGRPHAGGNGTARGIPPEESWPAEGKAGGKEKRPAKKESQLAGAAPRREEQKEHCGKI